MHIDTIQYERQEPPIRNTCNALWTKIDRVPVSRLRPKEPFARNLPMKHALSSTSRIILYYYILHIISFYLRFYFSSIFCFNSKLQ